MKYKFTAKCAAVRDLKREVDKSLADIYKTLEGNIDILEDEIDKKDKEIDELNKKIEELEKPKKTVEQLSCCKEVKLSEITSDQFVVSADVYISPEEYRDYRRQVMSDVNGNEFYLGKGEVINGRIKVKLISYSCYSFEEAKEVVKDLLRDGIYGNIKA